MHKLQRLGHHLHRRQQEQAESVKCGEAVPLQYLRGLLLQILLAVVAQEATFWREEFQVRHLRYSVREGSVPEEPL